MNPITLDPKLVTLINNKSAEDPHFALYTTQKYIECLTNHIDGKITLTDQQIKKAINNLVGYKTITLELPFNNLRLVRARKNEPQKFTSVDELSYIKTPEQDFPRLGRLNQSGEPLFYAAVVNHNKQKAENVALAEIDVSLMDKCTILGSSQKDQSDLNLRYIGLWDYVQRNRKPHYLPQTQFSYYQAAYQEMVRKFSPELLNAYLLADQFLADIMSRNGNDRLYQVTSIASAMMLESGIADGILYSSVAGTGEPVVALTPNTVDMKLKHTYVKEVVIDRTQPFHRSSKTAEVSTIEADGALVWASQCMTTDPA